MNDRNILLREFFFSAVSGVVGKDAAAELFDLFSQIALLPYEESESSGFLVVDRPNGQSQLTPLVSLEIPLDMHDVRGVRKLLQTSGSYARVLTDGRFVYGLVVGETDRPDSLLVRFRYRGVWELQRGGRVLFQVNVPDGEAGLNGLSCDGFSAGLQSVFGSLPPTQIHHLWSLIEAATRQRRGTNVLISAQADLEAERLHPQGMRVKPVELTALLMEGITSIDGTVIIDVHGVCHAIGAILDGPRTMRGDRARGGRYNSAVMYVDSCPFPSLIVVISQDGMVDLVSKHTGR